MDTAQQRDLLLLLKTLADEHRLTMVGLMNQREYTVSELAELFRLSEPTVSHHVSKMHSAGLLNLRMAGNQRFYRINEKRLEKFKAYAAEIGTLPVEPEIRESNNSWIDLLDWPEADKKVLRDYTVNGKLAQLPVKEKKWLVILRWLATRFQPGLRYTEKEVNVILTEAHEDYAVLRRNLIDYGFMRRERGGSHYWLTPENESIEV